MRAASSSSSLLYRRGLALSYVIPYGFIMSNTITATDARAKLYNLLSQVNTSHSPVTITGKSGNAVLVSEDDWNAVMETVALHAVPGLVEDINAGRDESIDTTPLTW
ncbi:MAG: prevent-host-death family protein [Actinomycetes bacterium]|jgi:antitoxin YefM